MSRLRRRAREAFTRAGLPLVVLALAACGSVTAGNSVAPAISTGPASPSVASRPLTLCAGQRAVTGVTIRRAGGVVRVPQEMARIPRFMVGPATAARSLARALCALPRQRPGTVHCPADFGITYQLRFTAGQRRFGVVTVDASGCQLVHGLSPVRTAAGAGASAVWTALGRAYRLPVPVSRRLFLGDLPLNRTCGRPSTMLTRSGKCPARAGSH